MNQSPFLPPPRPTYQPNNWNNLMELIRNDLPNQQNIAGSSYYGPNDHLQPILEYLRYDGTDADLSRLVPSTATSSINSVDQVRLLASIEPPRQPDHLPNNDGVIDLTLDDDIPIPVPRANPAEVIDLTSITTPPLINVRDYGIEVDYDDKTHGSANGSTEKDSKSSCLSLMCPVCLDGFDVVKTEGRQLISTKCGHVFCSSCIEDILRKHKCCPTCRKSVRKVSLRVIYL